MLWVDVVHVRVLAPGEEDLCGIISLNQEYYDNEITWFFIISYCVPRHSGWTWGLYCPDEFVFSPHGDADAMD